ncbi:DUF6351 family protein [Amycolatopsis sp. Hca4]|uniref:DUF6351 family protein n=1 Tax=Amycolatopsis sp. Hca4 TaxID=2742131 RepID=UPI0020CB1CDF|nr:DUF6351 family protein [Amycolatopsis sp. Hca4]
MRRAVPGGGRHPDGRRGEPGPRGLKCRLKPLDFRDYPVTFTAADRDRLRAAFLGGVRDYSHPDIGHHARSAPG